MHSFPLAALFFATLVNKYPYVFTSVSVSEYLRLLLQHPCCTQDISMPIRHRIAKLISKGI